MNYLIYIFLGIIQGLTEPLPISSSGHLYLMKQLFNTNLLNDLNFEIVVNFGSFIAIFFGKNWYFSWKIPQTVIQ